MAIAQKIKNSMEQSSWIRKMFEQGALLKAQYGADQVCDFSLGNPNLEPPPVVHQALLKILQDSPAALHAYMPNAGHGKPARPWPISFPGNMGCLSPLKISS